MKLVKKEYILSFAAILITLLCVEILLQFCDYPHPTYSGWKYRGDVKEINQLGYRGQHIMYTNDDVVILLLGDSQVVAKSSPFAMLPEQLLEFHLRKRYGNIKVFTLGTDGYGQDQQLLALEEYYQQFRADIVVLWFTYYNDIWNNIFPTHNLDLSGAGPKPTFVLKNERLSDPSEQFGEPIEKLKLLSLLKTALGYNRDNAWETYLPAAYSPTLTYPGEANQLWQDENFREPVEREKSHISPLLTPRSPRMQYGIDLTRNLLQKIEELVKMHKGIFLVVYPEHPYHYFLDSKIPVVKTIAETYTKGEQTYFVTVHEGSS